MTSSVLTPNVEQLQAWANDPSAAKANLPSIFSAVANQESLIDWANEALENCGQPEPMQLDFLLEQLKSPSDDVLYWTCKLIGRVGPAANRCQMQLEHVLRQDKLAGTVKKQAILALGRLGPIQPQVRATLEGLRQSSDANLSQAATTALEQTL
jgi:hypothetical protein